MTPALAEGQLLPGGTRCQKAGDADHPTIDVTLDGMRYLLTTEDVDKVLKDRKDLEQKTEALDLREAELAAIPDQSVLETLGWPVVIASVITVAAGAFAFGMYAQAEIEKHRAASRVTRPILPAIDPP